MATTHGNNGTVKIAANILAEIRSFSFNEEADHAEDSAIGDTAETHIAGEFTSRWTGRVECWWDPTDTLGQEALTIGASVVLNMYPEGAAASDNYRTGTASVIGIDATLQRGVTVGVEFRFRGNGALARATV